MLQNSVVPYLATTFPDIKEPVQIDSNIWFHQDEAIQHYGQVVRDFVNETFSNLWFGWLGHIEWPVNFTVLTTTDSSYLGLLKK